MDNTDLTAAYFAVCKRYNTDIAAQVVIELLERPVTVTPVRYALWTARRRWINSRQRGPGKHEIAFSHLPEKQARVIQGLTYGDSLEAE